MIADYLAWAGIKEGRVFRQIRRWGERIGDPIKTTDWFRYVLKKYSKMIKGRDGVGEHITPHMLRRTYARSQFDAVVKGDPDKAMQRANAIRQNMGHANLSTTFDTYIGEMDIAMRRAVYVIGPDFRKAAKQASKRIRIPKGETKARVREQNNMLVALEDAKEGWIFQRDLLPSGPTKSDRVALTRASTFLWKEGKLDKYDWSPPKHRGRPLRILTRPGVRPDLQVMDTGVRGFVIPKKVERPK